MGQALGMLFPTPMHTCGCGRAGGCNHGHGPDLAFGWDGQNQAMATKKEEELIIFRFRKVETMNPSNPEAKVVAVSGGRIVSVGSSMSEMAPWIRAAERKGMRVVVNEDFATKVAYPGFIEPHIHPLIGGTALSLPTVAFHPTPNPYDENRRDIPGCKTKAEVMRRLKEEEQKLTDAGDSDSDLLVWGWDTIAMYGDEELNRQASRAPIAFSSAVPSNAALLFLLFAGFGSSEPIKSGGCVGL